MVEDRQRDGRFPDSTSPDESNGSEIFCEANYPFNESITSETGSGRRGR